MENMLSEILNEIRDLKVTNEKEFKEIKEEQKVIREEQKAIREEQKSMKEQIAENTKLIKEATEFIIDTTKSIERTVIKISNEQAKLMRQLILTRNVSIEKDKSQDTILALHNARITKCEQRITELSSGVI